jgi:adenosylcobinamide-GDP ribazoletransferase
VTIPAGSAPNDTPLAALRGATGFLTIVGGSQAPTSRAMSWFPAVGALLGALVGAVWWVSDELWPPVLAAVIAVTADAILTGALHHDGLGDAADGLLPHMDSARRLEVMRTPDVGTFGIMALMTTTLIQVGSLASMDARPALIAGLWCASRTTMAVTARTVPYARTSGIATSFLGGSAAVVAVAGVALAAALATWSSGWSGLAAVAAVVLAGGGVVALAVRRIGGFTGDVLGAAGVVGQSVGLLVAAARW